MKIDRAEVYAVSIPYIKPFVNSWGTFPAGDHVILKLFADGLAGLGEAAVIQVDKGGEDQSAICNALTQRFGPALIGEDPFNIEGIMKKLDGLAATKYAFLYTKAAIDSALYDLMGKATGRAACDLIGGRERPALQVGRALGMASPGEMAEAALRLKEEGYRFLTVKVDGLDYRVDVARVKAVREAVGEGFIMDVDPNQSYSASECIPALRKMEAFDIIGVEQPCPAWDYDGMAKVAAALDVPVAADEGLITPARRAQDRSHEGGGRPRRQARQVGRVLLLEKDRGHRRGGGSGLRHRLDAHLRGGHGGHPALRRRNP